MLEKIIGSISKSKKGKTLLFYLVLINVSGILLLTLFNYNFFYFRGIDSFEKTYSSFSKKVTEEKFSEMDNLIRQAFYITEFYFTDMPTNQSVIQPQNEEIAQNPSAVINLINDLFRITNYQNQVYGIDIYYGNTDTIVTGSRSVHYYCDEKAIYEYLPWFEKLEGIKNTYVIPVDSNSYPDKQPVLTYVKRVSSAKWDKDMLVAVHIKDDVFKSLLNNSNEDYLYIQNAVGDLLYSNRNNPEFETIVKQADGDELSQIVEIDKQRYIYTRYKSSATGFEYNYFTSMSIYTNEYLSNIRILKVQFALSVLVNIVVLTLLSLINYVLYRRYLQNVYRRSGINIREKTQSIDKMLTMIEEDMKMLNSKSKDADLMITKSMIRKAVLNDEDDSNNVIGMSFIGKLVQCYFLIFSDKKLDRTNDIESFIQSKYTDNVECYALMMGKYQTVFVISSSLLDVGNTLLQYSDSLEAVYVGSSFNVADGGFRKSYMTAYEALTYRFLYPELRLIDFVELNTEGRKKKGNHLRYFSVFERELKIGDEQGFQESFDNLKTFFINGNFTVHYCLSTVWDLTAMIYNYMLQCQLDSWTVFGYDIREYCKSVEDIDIFEKWICQVVHEIISLLNVKNDSDVVEGNMASKLQAIIDENLENDLSLTLVAGKLGIRSDVLSKTFKDIMGKNYIEYVRERKLNRAIELLDQDYNVNEISDSLGYRSPQYFIRLFKDAFGITPFQYKKKNSRLNFYEEDIDKNKKEQENEQN